MFPSKHYVPVLKWKRAEYRALKGLDESTKSVMTPVIELVMPKVSNPYKDKERKQRKTSNEIFVEVVSKFKTQRTKEIPEDIKESWGSRPIFVDFSLLYEAEHTAALKADSMQMIISEGASTGLKLIPVVNLHDEDSIKKTAADLAKQYQLGFCVRVSKSDLKNTKQLNEKLQILVGSSGLAMDHIDILVDLKSIADNEYEHFLKLSQEIVEIAEWRNLILTAGSFPEDLTGCKFDEQTFLSRLEWRGWVKHVYGKNLKRVPTYGDYTMRNPIFKESSQFYPPTSSICYAVGNDWMVMKGKRQRFDLYLANAKLLVDSSGYFFGADHCAGDNFANEKAKHFEAYVLNPAIKGTGSSEDWIYVGINHHLALMASQVANLA
jgi:hypothetical protein